MKIEASQAGKKGNIRLVDMISMATESSSARVRAIVDDFLANGISSADVYINSRGGSTIEAVEIANELDRLPEVTLTIGAVAASAATYLMTKFKCRAYSNSQFMIHRPKVRTEGDVNAITSDLKLLENTTADYKQSYAAKMKKTEDEIEALFAKGDYWMTAAEAKTIGLLDEIIANNQTEITALDVEILTACGAPTIPDVTKQEENMKNRNEIIAALKLPADSTDEAILEAVKKNATAAATVDQVEATAKKEKVDKVEAAFDKAVVDKKTTADQKQTYMGLADKDPEGTLAIIEKLPVLEKPAPDASAEKKGDRSAWTMEDYQEKDPEALSEMMVKDPAAFKKLEEDYFGK